MKRKRERERGIKKPFHMRYLIQLLVFAKRKKKSIALYLIHLKMKCRRTINRTLIEESPRFVCPIKIKVYFHCEFKFLKEFVCFGSFKKLE